MSRHSGRSAGDACAMLVTAILFPWCGAMHGQHVQRLDACLDSCDRASEAGYYDAALLHLDEAWTEALELNDSAAMPRVLVKRSELHQRKGDFYGALTDLYGALRIYERNRDEEGLAVVYNHIGAVHHYDHNFREAQRFYELSLHIRERAGRPPDLALIYGNMGSLLEDMGSADSALTFHRRNLAIRRAIGEPRWIGVCYSNLGTCHDKLGHADSARHYLQAALALLDGEGDAALQSQVLAFLGTACLHAGAYGEAVSHCRKGLRIAQEQHALPVQENCYDCLYQVYTKQGRGLDALQMLEQRTTARDSMFGRERAKGVLRLELDYAFEREQLADSLHRLERQRQEDIANEQQLSAERDQKRVYLFGACGVLLLAVGLWSRLRYMRRSRNIIQRERDRSDALLLNILPRTIADELKVSGRAPAREVEGVSILFTDFHAFTELSEAMSAQELVAEIDACYRAFDAISARYGLEKIKTIGDAYMCAGGLPEPREGSVRSTVVGALAMQRWLGQRAVEREEQGLPAFQMRAGIHTGPVVAGIVGETKFQYDVWGDTVNIASRMEAGGAVNEVNISEATYALVQDDPELVFILRGRIKAKGKGELEMFFVRRASSAADRKPGDEG